MAAREREFTTWITAAVSPTAEAEARKLERIYDRTFDNIRLRAAAASRSAAGIVGGGVAAGRPVGNQVAEANRLAAANINVARTSALTVAQIGRHGAAIAQLEHRNAALVGSLRSSATALQVIQGPLGPVAGRITALSNAVERLTGFRLGIAAVGAAIFALTLAANHASQVRQKLAPLYETQEQVNAAFSRTVQIAHDTRTALEPVVDLYSRLTLVGRDVGLNPMQIERTTRAAALGARISGGNRDAQQAALTQFAQGIGSNRFGGDELRSIMEQAPRIAKAIADGLSNTEHFGRVTIGMLRTLGANGELTAQRVAGALGRSLHQLEEEAKRIGPTLSSSVQSFGTEFTANVSRLDQAVGLIKTFAGAIQFAADNMREITATVGGFAVAWAAVKIMPNLGTKITEFRGFVSNMVQARNIAAEAATREHAAAQQAVIDLGRQNTSLQVRRQNIEANMRAAEAEVAVRRQNVANLAPFAAVAAGAGGAPGSEEAIRAHAEEVDKLHAAEQRLREEDRRLTGVQLAQANTTMGLTQAVEHEERAKTAAGRATSRLKFYGASLIQAINPLGIIIGIATAALFEFAMAESQAERDAKRLEEVQRQLADAFDDTTGRIREQNREIREGIALRADEATTLAGRQFRTTAGQTLQSVEEALTVGHVTHHTESDHGQAVGGGGTYETPIYVGGPGGARAQTLIRQVQQGQLGLIQFADRMEALAARNPQNTQIAAALEAIRRQLPNLQDQDRARQQAAAQARVARGSTSVEDLRLVRGDFTHGRVEGQTPAQLNAAAEAERGRLRDPRYRARTTMERSLTELQTRQGNMSAPDFIRERAQILHTYDQELEQIERTEHASQHRAENEAERARDKRQQLDNLMSSFQDDAPVRQLERVFDQAERAKGSIRDLIGEQVEGIGRFTAAQADARIREVEASVRRQSGQFLTQTMDRFEDDTPIRRMRELATQARNAKRDIDALVGRSVDGYEHAFTQEDANRLKGQIDTYVETERRRPITDFVRQSEQELSVQRLILQGREAEAAALEHAYQLREQSQELSADDLKILYQSELEHRRINDLIGERQRIVENLVSVSEDARQAIEGAVGQLERGRPDRAATQFFHSMVDSYFRVQVRSLTDRLMQGTDRRITDLVNGRVRVDGAVAQITTGMHTAGSAAMDFASRLRAAATVIDAARADAQPGPGASAIITPRSAPPITDRIQIKNPLANMVVGGDNYAQHVARGSSGVDLRAAPGTEVRAPFAGTLTYNHSAAGGLQAFVTSLDGRVRAGFAHLNAVTVEGLRQGMQVAAGQAIARSGNTGINPATGRSVDPHLHSSLRIDGRSVDPMLFYGRTVQMAARTGDQQTVARAATTMAAAADRIQGLLVPGNIDIMHRPRHLNPDGSISTVRSMSFGTDQGEVLVPTIAEDGRLLSDRQAMAQYQRTGRHLGIFDNPQHADAYAQQLHVQQEAMIRGAGALTESMQQVKRLVDALPDDSGRGQFGTRTANAIDAGITPGASRVGMDAMTGLIGDLHEAIAGPQGIQMSNARAAQTLGELPGSLDDAVRGAAAPAAKEAEAGKVQTQLGLRELYNRLGADIGNNLDKLLGTNFASKIGGKLGDVLAGAGKGQMASGVARMLGIKQSNTGAQIGGAIGQLAAPFLGPLAPFAPFIGGLIGGTIGGLFKKTPHSSTTVSAGQYGDFVTGGTSGTSSALRDAADALGGSVGSGLKNIADALYGTVTGTGSVSIGERKGKFIVDPTGRGRTKGSGTLSFDDEQKAVEAAIKIMIEKGVIGGISAASQRIIQAGKDLQTAITKAAAIEQIPRSLMAIKDPVRFALMELNRQFVQLIGYLKEGGATAEQFAQAQELYDYQRQQAINQAMQQAAGQIQAFLDEMLGGQSSPLNRRTVYSNAKEQIDRFTGDIMGGKIVDESQLLAAAKNFEDASRGLNGSSESFFTDFQWLYDLLAKARDNALGGADTTTPLPDSPFATDPSIQSILNGTTTAITDQTTILAGLLGGILDVLGGMGGGGGGGSSILSLPGFGFGSGAGGRIPINMIPNSS